jgi:hypothetical protein
MIITGVVMLLLFLGLVALLVLQREHVQTYDEVRKEHRLKNLAELNGEFSRNITGWIRRREWWEFRSTER